MKIVIIGSGNLATQLSLALQKAGKDIVQVYSRSEEHARTLAEKIGCDFTTDVEDINRQADIYIVSIKDDAISEMAATLAGVSMILHTAGSIPMDVFSGHAQHYGVLYPMQTFSKNRQVDFREIPCFIEASDEATLTAVRSLAESISSHVVDCDSERRKKMHLAAVLACNLANHCYRLAERVVEAEHIDFRLFQPLIMETARKVATMSPRDAQTGPMVRYDQRVMDMQIQMLPDERTRDIYRLMADSIHEDQ
ncbi:MAG: DUF2520 domain-containing protein [Prevotella sp.]|nr:DUF2520 domain-containing protein [Prevotella sp.]